MNGLKEVELNKFILGEQHRIRLSMLPQVIKLWDKEGEGSFAIYIQEVTNVFFNNYAWMN